MRDTVVGRLDRCDSLDQFYDVCAPLGLYGAGRRFIQFELDIINRCNLRCVMCYHSLEATRRARTAYLTAEAFAAIAERVLPHTHRLSLSLGNEPLTSPHFIPILRVAARYDLPHVNFYTNGLLLNDETIDAIVEHRVTQVCISVDGATRSTYNYIRRDGDFDRLVRNIERLVTRRHAAGSLTPRVRFDITMMQRNIHEMPDLVTLAARLGAQELSFRHLVAFEGLAMEPESLTRTKALSNYWLDRALARAAELRLEVQHHPEPFELTPPARSPEAPPAAPFLQTPYCPFPFFHVTVTPGGQVLPCPHAHGEEPYGEVSRTTTLDEIWLGPRFTELRQRILRHDPPDMCRRCPFLSDKYPDVPGFFATRKQ